MKKKRNISQGMKIQNKFAWKKILPLDEGTTGLGLIGDPFLFVLLDPLSLGDMLTPQDSDTDFEVCPSTIFILVIQIIIRIRILLMNLIFLNSK